MTGTVRVVIFDLDGVIRRWPPESNARIEDAYGLPRGALLQTAFEPGLLGAAVTGAISDEDWRATVADRLRAEFGVDGRAAARAWADSDATVDAGVLAVVQDVRRRVPVALLTNATSRLARDLDRLALSQEFDHVFSSAELGVAKPDPACFERVVAALGVAAEHCAFVDDTPGHAAAAERAGLRTHVFDNTDALRTFLRIEGVLAAGSASS